MDRNRIFAGASLVLASLGCTGGGAASSGGSKSTTTPAITSSTTTSSATTRTTTTRPAAPTATPVGGPSDPGADGQWSTRKVVLQTLAKGQASTLDVRLPVGTTGPRPVIVINHGWITTTSFYEGIAEHLATRGFAVGLFLQPNIASTSTPDWSDQLRGAIDALEAANATGGTLAGELDLSKLGLMGHSYGGATAIWAGADDTRVKAVVALTPVNQYHFADLKAHSGRLAVPLLVLAGENDTLSIPVTYTRPIYDAATAAPRHLYVEVTAGAHGNFCDLGKLTSEYRLSAQYHTAWFETFLGGAADPLGFTDGTRAQTDLAAGRFCEVR